MSLSHPIIKKILGIPEAQSRQPTEAIPTSQKGQDESLHINQEMYKKGVELSEKNKTLSILEKINELIQGSITNLNEIANEVAVLLVKDAGFNSIAIFLFDEQKNVLVRLARTRIDGENHPIIKDTNAVEISLDNKENFIVQAIE